jgi:hypothetical protein
MIRVVSPPPLLPPVCSSHDGHRSPVHDLKGIRGYRAIARRRRRGRRRRRPAAPPVGRCAAWVQVPRSAARSARLSTRAVGPEISPSAAACGEARANQGDDFPQRDGVCRVFVCVLIQFIRDNPGQPRAALRQLRPYGSRDEGPRHRLSTDAAAGEISESPDMGRALTKRVSYHGSKYFRFGHGYFRTRQ